MPGPSQALRKPPFVSFIASMRESHLPKVTEMLSRGAHPQHTLPSHHSDTTWPLNSLHAAFLPGLQ